MPKPHRIEIFPKRNLFGKRRWYFRIKAGNGEIVAQSEGYSNRCDCKQTATLLRDRLIDADIFGIEPANLKKDLR